MAEQAKADAEFSGFVGEDVKNASQAKLEEWRRIIEDELEERKQPPTPMSKKRGR